MKISIQNNAFIYFLFFLFVFSSNNQITDISTVSKIKIDKDIIKDLDIIKPVIPIIPKIKIPPILLNPDKAVTYKGVTQINIPQGPTNRAQYYISFSKYTESCTYAACYYGWVDNYTKEGEATVQGYPQGTSQVRPIFIFQTNSKTDFAIIRQPRLQVAFINIIQLACELFEPTIRNQSQNLDAATLASNLKIANLRAAASGSAFTSALNTQSDYAFIPQAQFQKFQPESTFRIDPSLISDSTIKTDIRDIQTVKNLDFIKNINRNDLRIAAVSRRLDIKDLLVNKDDLKQQIVIDKDYNILRRSRFVSLDLKSESFSNEQNPIKFLSDINVQFQLSGSQNTSHATLRNYINSFSVRAQQISFNSINIQARRKIEFSNEKFDFVERKAVRPQILTLKENIAIKDFLKDFLICYLNPSSSGQKIIFSYYKVLFQKSILGKQFKVSIKIDASIVNNKNIRFKGVVIYELFGSSRTVQVFNYLKDISFSWSSSYPLNGSWSFSIYIPLPPPVSFLGINFSFTVSFGLNIDLYAKGNPMAACIYNFEVGANVGTQVGVDASAAVRAVVIQGGVYIGGTLVRLSTDPKLNVAVNVKTQNIITHVTWYFYLNAFSFEWGFFYRYWKLFSGWSSRKIIAKWPVTNGITQKYLIYKS